MQNKNTLDIYFERKHFVVVDYLNENVQERDRHDEEERDRRGVAQNDKRVYDVHEAEHEYLKRVGYGRLDRVDVFGEAVDDATGGRRLEKVQRAAQYRREKILVEQLGRSNVHEHDEQVGHVEKYAFLRERMKTKVR